MKKFLFLLWIGACWYLAGMYRLFPLLVVAVVGVLVFLIAGILPFFLKKQLELSFPQSLVLVEKGEEIEVDLRVKNKGRLPAGRFGVRFRCFSKAFRGQKQKCKRSGSVAAGETEEIRAGFSMPFCGLFFVSVHRAYVYDYLSLFRSRISRKPQLEVAVLPPLRRMKLEFAAESLPESAGFEQSAPLLSGNNREEIRQIRAYAPGDTYRMIHWNQSARTDTLLVKEYSREEERRVRLFLDLMLPKKTTPQAESVFYELLYALLMGLLSQQFRPVVVWQNESGRQGFELSGEQDCCELMVRLYREKIHAGQSYEAKDEWGEGLRFGRDLCLWYNGTPAVSFTETGYEEELEQRIHLG